MSQKIRDKIRDLTDTLRITTISKQETAAINERINSEMEEFRREFLQKQRQFERDAAKIVLNS